MATPINNNTNPVAGGTLHSDGDTLATVSGSARSTTETTSSDSTLSGSTNQTLTILISPENIPQLHNSTAPGSPRSPRSTSYGSSVPREDSLGGTFNGVDVSFPASQPTSTGPGSRMMLPPTLFHHQLYLGSLNDALRLPLLESSFGVELGLVVTCLPERNGILDESVAKLRGGDVRHLYFEIDDTFSDAGKLSEKNNESLRGVLDAMLEVSDSGRAVFVHCEAGITRSPSLMAMFMITRLGMKYAEATRVVQSCRPQCRLRIFDNQLRKASVAVHGGEEEEALSLVASVSDLNIQSQLHSTNLSPESNYLWGGMNRSGSPRSGLTLTVNSIPGQLSRLPSSEQLGTDTHMSQFNSPTHGN